MHPIHQIGVRSNLLLGGHRGVVIFLGTVCAMLILTTFNLLSMAIGFGLWLFGLWATRMMARHDPLLVEVFLRNAGRYQRIYLAHSSPWRRNGPVQARRYRR